MMPSSAKCVSGWGRYVEKGAERKDRDELMRGLREAVKPKLYAYDRYADAYPRAPT